MYWLFYTYSWKKIIMIILWVFLFNYSIKHDWIMIDNLVLYIDFSGIFKYFVKIAIFKKKNSFFNKEDGQFNRLTSYSRADKKLNKRNYTWRLNSFLIQNTTSVIFYIKTSTFSVLITNWCMCFKIYFKESYLFFTSALI